MYYLAADGLAPLWATSVRPLTRIEVAGVLARSLDRVAAHPTAASQAGLMTLERLALQFGDELSLLGYQIVTPPIPPSALGISGWGVRMSRVFVWRAASGTAPWFEPDAGSTAGAEFGAIAGLGPRLAFGIDLQSSLVPPPAGMRIDRLYISGDGGEWGRVQAGLDRGWWGPGSRGAWLLSDWPGAVETVRWSLEWERLRAVKLLAPIGLQTGRYLYGMRVDWLATDNIRVGLGESVLASGGLVLPYALSPILPITYGIANSRRQSGLQDNYNVAVDFDWRIRRGIILYGELFIDELAISSDPYPSRGGATAGIFLADPFRTGRTTLRAEHSRSTNWTYTTPGSVNDYVRNGKALGHWCAPDCELWSAQLSHRASANGVVQVNWDFVRRGEGRIGQSWPAASDAWTNLYLSGVVETTQSWRLSYIWTLGSRSRHEVGVGLSSVANAAHVSGAVGQDWFFWWEARHAF